MNIRKLLNVNKITRIIKNDEGNTFTLTSGTLASPQLHIDTGSL